MARLLARFLFGAGTLVTLAIIRAAFPLGLWVMSGLKEADARRFGAQVGATTIFAGSFLFTAGGSAMALGINRNIPFDFGYAVIALLVVAVAIPAFIYAWRGVKPHRCAEVEFSRDSAQRPPELIWVQSQSARRIPALHTRL